MSQRGKLMVPITNCEPDLDELIVDIFNSRYGTVPTISSSIIYYLCQHIRSILLSQSVQIAINSSVTIVGDLHGQLFDLLRIFLLNGIPPETTYLFLGDYVDRGKYGVETLCLLYALKLQYPTHIYLLRGNHESASINRMFGFQTECLLKYGDLLVWNAFVSTFNVLPFSAVIQNKILCLHGGISPLLKKNSQLKHIHRPTDIPWDGLLCDLVWSDYVPKQKGFVGNENRGVAVVFGEEELKKFLDNNGFELLIRGHEFVNGIKISSHSLSVFSCSCYQGIFQSSAGYLTIDDSLKISFHILTHISQKEIEKLEKSKKETNE